MTNEIQALVQSLEYNSSILEIHNRTGRPVKQITGGMRTENELINDLIADVNRVLTKLKDETLVEVVRCKNCEYLVDLRCEHPDNGDGKIHLDYHCGYGERRCNK